MENKTVLSNASARSNKYPLWLEILFGVLAFVLPLVVLIIIFSANGYYLFGHTGRTIIMLDMQSQYIAILRDLRDVLLSGRSLIYTTNRTLGGEYLSIFTYYAASPFNLLTIFLNETDLPVFFAWSNLIKMAFGSLNLYLLFRFSTKETKIGHLGFAFAYGLISYSLVEMHNFMWLDCVMILPLIILGLKYLEEGKFHWIYALSLAYALLTSWYLGAIVCMFVTLFFLYRYIIIGNQKNGKAFLIRFIVSSLAGGLIAATFWMPAISHLVGTKATGEMPKEVIFFPISMFFSGLLSNNFVDPEVLTLYSGYTTMFTSVITLVFFQLFFFNKSFTLKERLVTLGLFVAYFLIISSNQLNAFFHGGQEPTWFPARYSFIIGFFICYIGGLSFSKVEKTPRLAILAPAGTALLVALIVTLVPNPYTQNKGVGIYQLNGLSVVLYCACLVMLALYLSFKNGEHKNNKIIELAMPILMIALTIISSADGANRILNTYKKTNYGQLYETYAQDNVYQEGINQVKALEPEANYRMELLVNRPGTYNEINNNPIFYSYSGLSHFSSTSKRAVLDYFQKLGYHNNYFFEKFDGGSTLAVSSLLGLKYLIDDPNVSLNPKPAYQTQYPFEEMTNLDSTDNELLYYKNNYAMPLGFAANSLDSYYVGEGKYVEGHGDHVYWYDHFEYQNEIFKTFVSDILDEENKQKDIFVPLEITDYQLTDLTYTEDEWGRKRLTSTASGPGRITITFKEPSSGNYNLYLGEKNLYNDAKYYLDGASYEMTSYWHKGLRGFAHEGYSEVRTYTVQFNNSVADLEFIPELYAENIDVLGEYIQALKDQAAGNLQVINGRFTYGLIGKFTITKENQAFYFTLPYDKNFQVYVDGKIMKSEVLWNIFTGAKLTGISLGEHHIKIVYIDTSFIFGLVVSAIGIGGLVGIVVIENSYKKKIKKLD